MAATRVVLPPPVTIVANSWFHDGWLHGVLGLGPRTWDNPDGPVLDGDIDAWVDGYDMAVATEFNSTPVFRAMIAKSQLVHVPVLG